MVASHNDYRQGGELKTFWLMTHPSGRYVKAEGLVVVEDKVLEELREKAEAALRDFVAPAPTPVTIIPRQAPCAKLDRPLMQACAERILRRGKPVSPETWDAKEMLQYFGCLLQKVRDTAGPARFIDMKERRSMTRLISWLGAKQTKRLIEFCVFSWAELAERFGIKSAVPTVPIIYGFRQSLVDALQNGLPGVREGESRTHRSDFASEDAQPRRQRAFG